MNKKQIENKIKRIDNLFEDLSKGVDKMDKYLISEFVKATMDVFYNPIEENIQDLVEKREKIWDSMNKKEKEKSLRLLDF